MNKNLQTISQSNQELKLIKPGKFDFKIHSNSFTYVDNYFDDIYMKNQKMRNRSYSISKEEREIIHLKIVFLSVDLLNTVKIDGEIFSFSFTIMNYSIYDNSVKSKFYLLKQWNKCGNEVNQKLFSLHLKGYSHEHESILDIFEIKHLPVELIIDLSTISFLMNFFNFSSETPSIDKTNDHNVNKSEIFRENKENTGNYIVRNFIISSVEFKINTRYKGSNHVFGNALDTLAPKFIQIKNFEDNIKEFKRQYDLNDKFPLQIIINELVDFYYTQFTKYSFLSNALASIRILRPIGDFFNGIINVFRLPIKYYIKGDNVLIGLAHGVGNLFYKWSRGSYQLCKNV